MQTLKYQPIWLAIGLTQLCLVIWLSLFTDGAPFHEEQLTFFSLGIDKFQHLFAYAFLMLWLGQLSHGTKALLAVVLLLLLMGTTTELLQALHPSRQSNLGDLMANILGVMAGLFILNTPAGNMLLRVEQFIKPTE